MLAILRPAQAVVSTVVRQESVELILLNPFDIFYRNAVRSLPKPNSAAMPYSISLTDEEWAILQPFLVEVLPQKKRTRPTNWTKRKCRLTNYLSS